MSKVLVLRIEHCGPIDEALKIAARVLKQEKAAKAMFEFLGVLCVVKPDSNLEELAAEQILARSKIKDTIYDDAHKLRLMTFSFDQIRRIERRRRPSKLMPATTRAKEQKFIREACEFLKIDKDLVFYQIVW